MFSKIHIVILCIFAFSAIKIVTSESESDTNNHVQFNLLDFMLRTRDISNQNPQRSIECFGYYLPLLNEIGETYNRTYNECIENGVEAKRDIDNSTEEARGTLRESSESTCQLLTQCSDDEDIQSSLQCYITGSSQNNRIMNSISANATEILGDVKEKYMVIEFDEKKCKNTCERVYNADLEKAYSGLQSCLDGTTTVPSN